MAELQKLSCEAHGGYFYREPKRGQKPKNCGGNNAVCDAATNAPVEQEPQTRKRRGARKDDFGARVVRDTEAAQEPQTHVVKSRAAEVASTIKNRRVEASQRKAPARNGANPSLSKGKAAKELLEAQGWTVAGKAWEDESGGKWASVTGARGEELVTLAWLNGEVQEQTYSLWNLDKPSANGKPASHLPFDPEEVGDQRLAQILSGASVTWYNKLSGKEETGVIGDKVTVEHLYNGEGDETPGARIIKFIDHTLGHFKAFRLDQLLKVK